ncbi:MAG: SLC13 family permease [bacterium]|nr:SLC13 family permease [bacterium]
MSFQFWYTSLLLVVMTVVLVKEWLDMEITVTGVLMLLIVGNVVTAQEAFSGFSNVGILSIGVLFVVAGSVKSTGLLDNLNRVIYGKRTDGLTSRLLRLMFPVTLISAFMNNTPIVAMLIPSVRSWARKNGFAVSRFLLPLSYAAILGGMCTLIGTSTNLIVHGLLIQYGNPGFTFFEISRIGIPAALIGMGYIALLAGRQLPYRTESIVELGENTREYVIGLKVTEKYSGLGKTIEQAGLRHLKGLFLFQVERDTRILAPANPDQLIRKDDRLFFTGIPETIMELQKIEGLRLIKDSTFDLKNFDSQKVNPFEVVVSSSSPLMGKSVRESNFRLHYNAVIIAIHRSGHRIQRKIGDIVLHPGDTLLLLAPTDFYNRWYHSKDFYLVSNPLKVDSKPKQKKWITGLVILGMVICMVSKIIPLIAAAAIAAMTLVLTQCVSRDDALSMVDWRVLVVIASAFGIGVAIKNSGVADFLAGKLVLLGEEFGTFGVLCGVYFLTSLYNTIISSNATAALFFPIAMSSAAAIGADLHPFALAVAISAAASFASPISYQTNLMVYGPGGYKFTDYLKFGIPLQLIIGILAVSMIYLFYF